MKITFIISIHVFSLCLLVINSKRADYKKLFLFIFVLIFLCADVMEELHRIAFRFVLLVKSCSCVFVCIHVYRAVIGSQPWPLIQSASLSLIIHQWLL